MPIDVLRFADVDSEPLADLLGRFGLRLQVCPAAEPIPASYWGDSEAGLRDDRLFARADTPLHSILHEACHYICMDAGRRQRLDADAGSDEAEENAVCFLQILLADHIEDFTCLTKRDDHLVGRCPLCREEQFDSLLVYPDLRFFF